MPCHRTKTHRHIHLQAAPIPVPRRPFAYIHVDLVGPLPPSKGFTYLFTVIDRTTRWPEAIPLSSTTASDCAEALFSGWIVHHGVPNIITSDRGAQFTSALWASLCHLLQIHHSPTTAYHPESNGLVERLHRRLKDALRARCASVAWASHLPWILLSLRSTTREDSNFTPAEAVYGSPLVLPGQFLSTSEPPLDTFLTDLHGTLSRPAPPLTRHNTTASSKPPQILPAQLLQASFVLVRRGGHVPPLAPLYDGPYRVLKRSLHTFPLQIGDRIDVVSVHRLKPTATSEDTQPALPPPRGRLRLTNHRKLPLSSPSAPATKFLKQVQFNMRPNFIPPLSIEPRRCRSPRRTPVDPSLTPAQPRLRGRPCQTLVNPSPEPVQPRRCRRPRRIISLSTNNLETWGEGAVEDELYTFNLVYLEYSSTREFL